MAKFLSIPVTGRGNILVSADSVALIEQKNTTTVRISYLTGSQTDLTHAAAAPGNEAQRDVIATAILSINQRNWQITSQQVDNLPNEVVDINTSLTT